MMTPRWVIELKSGVPLAFPDFHQARQYFDQHQEDVRAFFQETLVSEFDKYRVWREVERYYPEPPPSQL